MLGVFVVEFELASLQEDSLSVARFGRGLLGVDDGVFLARGAVLVSARFGGVLLGIGDASFFAGVAVLSACDGFEVLFAC